MPQLPDLRAKIKLDFADLNLTAAQAKILGEVLKNELGGSRGSEIDASMRKIGASVQDTGNKMDQAGRAFVKFGQDGEVATLRLSSSTAKTRADFDKLEVRTRALGQTLDTEFRKGTTAVVRLTEDGDAAFTNLSRTMGQAQGQLAATGTAATQAGGGIAAMGVAGAVLIGVGIALAATLAPLVVTLGAFVLGVAAVATVITIGLGAILALAAGITFLAIQTQGWMATTQTVPQAQQAVTTASLAHASAVNNLNTLQKTWNATSTHTQTQLLALQSAQNQVNVSAQALTKAQEALTAAQKGAVNPLQTLKTHLGEMAQTLGQQAAPMAALFLGYVDKLVPSVQSMGQALLTWFGPRLSGIFQALTPFVTIFMSELDHLGQVLGHFIDSTVIRSPQLAGFFALMLNTGVRAVDALLANLLRLSDWFLARLPAFLPVVETVFGGLGRFLMFVIEQGGRLADWTITHWPQIVATIASIWTSIQQGWALVGPVLASFKDALAGLAPVFTFIKDHAENLKPVLVALGFVMVAMVVIFGAVVIAGALVVAALVGIATAVTMLVNWVKSWLPQAGAQFSWLGSTAQQMGRDIGATFSQIGGFMQVLVRAIGDGFWAMGNFIRTAVGEYQQAGRDIGSVFSGIGFGARGMADAVGGAFGGLKDNIWSGLHNAADVFNNFGNLVNGALGGFGIHINAVRFAQGGTVPGYAPGVDSVPALLSPGEGVLTPQTVRGLGGAGAIEALNRGGGLGAGLGALSATIGAIGGQCVEFIQAMLGLTFRGNANTWVGAPYAHTQTAAPGEVAVFTGGPYGHVAIVTGAGDGYNFPVIDSNWVAPLTIGEHMMNKGMYGFSTFLETGVAAPFGTGSPLSGLLPSLGSILKGLLSGLLAPAHAAANSIPDVWVRPLANSLLDKVQSNLEGRASGGPILPGHLYTVGEQGPELFSSNVPGQIIPGGQGGGSAVSMLERLERAVWESNRLLAAINGTPSLDRGAASRRYAT